MQSLTNPSRAEKPQQLTSESDISRFNYSINNSSQLRTAYNTASGNSCSNQRPLQFRLPPPPPPPNRPPRPQQKQPTPSARTTLMIKNIEITGNEKQTDGDGKEEETEICNMQQRRDSVPDDGAAVTQIKLNTIDEHAEQRTESSLTTTKSSHPVALSASSSSTSFWSLPSQKSRNDLTPQVDTATALAPITDLPSETNAASTNSTSAASITEEQQQNATNTNLENFNTNNSNASNQQKQLEPLQLSPPSTSETQRNDTTNQDGQGSTAEAETESTVAATVTSATSTSSTANIGQPQQQQQHQQPSPNDSPQRKSSKWRLSKTPSYTKIASSLNLSTAGSASGGIGRCDEDSVSKSSDTSGELPRLTSSSSSPPVDAIPPLPLEKSKSVSRLSDRVKKKSWYNVLYPNYKSRSEDFKKLFKEVPNEERLIVDYSCALQREILAQGRLYVSQNFVCFHANIFSWETLLTIRWKDVTSITKEKTALVIPNAISIYTAKEKYFFATFAARDKAFLMLFRIWQNTLMNKPMLPQELWQWVHNCYGEELGLTTDDEDYIDPTSCQANDTEAESSDFMTAVDDTNSAQNLQAISEASEGAKSAETTANIKRNNQANNSGNSSAGSSGGGGGGGRGIGGSASAGGEARSGSGKTKRSLFFSSNKSNSNTGSPSGSDNKASDNNCSGQSEARSKSAKSQMKAKELTLTSAAPDESSSLLGNGASSGGGRAGDGPSKAASAGSGGSVSSVPGALTGAIPKDPKRDSVTSSIYDTKRKVSKNSRQRDESAGKNAEQIPTDMSDSSDSDQKIPFVVTAECTSLHEGRQIMHTILPINIDTLFSLLFSKSKFLENFHAMRKSTDCHFGEWVTNEEGQQARTVNLTVQLAASVGPKTSKVTEQQVMRECSKPGELYSIDVNSTNSGIPYADSFCVILHYCLVRTVDDHTMLSMHAQIKYKKSIWGVVKGLIEKNTWAGLEDFYGALLQCLQNETCIPPAKSKGRRPRKGTSSSVRPQEEPPPIPVKLEPSESPIVTPLAQVPSLPIVRDILPVESKRKYAWLSLFVIILLCFLITMNVILLLKLWKLEERIEEDIESRARMPNLSALKELPNSHHEWLELMRHQEILHETELKKWHTVLQTAIELLKKTEKTLAGLMFR